MTEAHSLLCSISLPSNMFSFLPASVLDMPSKSVRFSPLKRVQQLDLLIRTGRSIHFNLSHQSGAVLPQQPIKVMQWKRQIQAGEKLSGTGEASICVRPKQTVLAWRYAK